MEINAILMKALSDDLIDIKTFRFYGRLIHLGEQALIYQGKDIFEISEKTIGENYVDHVRKIHLGY